jgi:Uma2 family endonuclease
MQSLKLSFEEYLSLASGQLPEGRFEYVNGELRELPPEPELNNWIARYLAVLLSSNRAVALRLIVTHSCEVEVPVMQEGDARTRIPDLVILRLDHLPLLHHRLTVTREMPPPLLIAEVVSPGNANQQRDYERKRQQYEELGVLEYWLIDPKQGQVKVLKLQSGSYQEVGVFQGQAEICSPLFPALSLTAEQVLMAE